MSTPTDIRDPDIPVTLGAFRALQDEVRRLDAALCKSDQALKAAAFDNLMGVINGKHEVVDRFSRQATGQPSPGVIVREEVYVCEWRFRVDANEIRCDLAALLVGAERRKARHA